jgi:dipeptidyl aminopeptidase/acylaminoacyl peptidase
MPGENDISRVSAKDFLDIVQVADPRLSPDGSEVAFVRTVPDDRESYEATIYVVPTNGEDAPRRFTAVEGSDGHPRYSPDGDLLAFTSARGEAEQAQLWLIPTDGGEAEQVTSVPGGINAFEWSPDGERILFTQAVTAEERETEIDCHVEPEYEREVPDPRVIDRMIYRQFQQYTDGQRSHIYLLDVPKVLGNGTDNKGAGITRITDGNSDFVSPTWGDTATLYYAVQRVEEPDDSIVYEVDAFDIETRTKESLFEVTEYLPTLTATKDGRVAFTAREDHRASMRQAGVGMYDSGETQDLTEHFDRTVAALVPPGLTWVDDDTAVQFVASNEGSVGVWAAPTEGTVTSVVDDGTLSAFHTTAAGTAFTRSKADYPGDVFFLPAGADAPRRLTRVNADYLSGGEFGTLQTVHFEAGAASSAQRTTTDGTPVNNEIQGWVLTPPNYDATEDHPLLVQVHGGPHVMYTSSIAFHEYHTLAAAGYVVFWCNPRGSTGYGQAFAEAIERDWGAITMSDIEAGVEYVLENYAVDQDEQYLTGGSFGGFMTGWLVGHTDRYRAAVAQRGVYDLSSFYGSTDAFRLIEGDFDTTPWEDPAFLWEQSPVAHVEAVNTPTLVMHAENDYRVPVNNGEMFYLFLRKQGVDTRLVRYPREGHELSRSGEPGHVVDRIERIRRWMDGYSDYKDVPRALDRGYDEGLELGAQAENAEKK